jgi:superoxide dismutase, Cu-Zn family
MKKTGLLCVSLLAALAACGGSGKSSQSTTPASDVAAASSENSDLPPMANPAPPPPSQAEPAEPTPAVPPAEMTPEPMTPPPAQNVAIAMLTTVKDGKDVGMMTFELGENNQITMTGEFNGLPPGPKAIYVHEGGDCKKIGGHLNPTSAKHGPPSSSERHAGDFGNIEVDKGGTATFSMMTDSLSFEAGRADTITGRTLVIHAKKDDKKGSGGAALACGVINMRQ